jgi:hypothetical protein
MDAPVVSTYYLPLSMNDVFNLVLPLVCCVEGSLEMALFFRLGLTYI